MENKEELLKEFERAFSNLKKKLGFKVSLDELDSEFHVIDYVLETGHVRKEVSMQIASRIVDHFRNWANYLNSLLIPNPGFMANQTESKLFSEEKDRKEIWEMIRLCMMYSSKYSLMFLEKNLDMQRDFIDGSLRDYKSILAPFLKDVMKKVYDAWEKD